MTKLSPAVLERIARDAQAIEQILNVLNQNGMDIDIEGTVNDGKSYSGVFGTVRFNSGAIVNLALSYDIPKRATASDCEEITGEQLRAWKSGRFDQ